MSLPFTPDLQSSFKKYVYIYIHFKIIIIILRNFFMTSIILLSPFFSPSSSLIPQTTLVTWTTSGLAAVHRVAKVLQDFRPSECCEFAAGTKAPSSTKIHEIFPESFGKKFSTYPWTKIPKRPRKKLSVYEGIPFI